MFPEGLEMLMGKGLAKMMRMVCPWKNFWHFFFADWENTNIFVLRIYSLM